MLTEVKQTSWEGKTARNYFVQRKGFPGERLSIVSFDSVHALMFWSRNFDDTLTAFLQRFTIAFLQATKL